MEFLKAVLGEELYQQVATKLAGNDKIKLANLATGEYVNKDKFADIETQANERKVQLEAMNAELTKIKDLAGNSAETNAKLSELQKKYDTDTQTLNAKLAKQQLDNTIDLALITNKARNTRAVKALLEVDKLTFDNNKLQGFDEQLKAIKDSNPFLFEDGEVANGAGGAPQGPVQKSASNGFDFTGAIPDVLPKTK